MTQEVYLEILACHLLPFGLNRFGTDWFLHQDNDPKHTSRLCAFFLEQNEIKWASFHLYIQIIPFNCELTFSIY